MRKLYVNSSSSGDREEWLALLAREGIRSENTIQDVFGIYEEDRLIATGARFQNIIKCIAIDDSHQGTSVFNELITGLHNEVIQGGYDSCYVYTKQSARKAFTYVGFQEIQHVDETLYFMENAVGGFPRYLEQLNKSKVSGENVAAIVMNANPFTKGHLYLVTKASQENDAVHLFVLSEDLSEFSAGDRMELVKKGTAHLSNVFVHPTSYYMVSAATFPSYFLQEDDDITAIQSRLDAKIFRENIAPVLGITARYVGSEPYSRATNIYNQSMEQEFEGGLQLKIFDRIETHEDVISASKVRKLLAQGKIEEAQDFVPPTTYEFFFTPQGQHAIEQLRK